MPAHSVSEGVDSAVVAFVSSSCYAPPTTLPPLEPSEWEDLASISPKGAVTRKALRDAHEISGKLAFDYAIIQIVAQSEGLIGKPPGFSTTIQRAVGSEEHLKLILRQVDRDLVVNARVLPGFLQFIGAYLAQVDGDILQLIAWLSPIFQPVLSVASKAYLVSKVPQKIQLDPTRKLRICGDHQFLLNARGIQQASELEAVDSPTSSANSEEEEVDTETLMVLHGRLALAPTPSPVRFDRTMTPRENDIMSTDMHRFYNSPLVRDCPGEMNPEIWRFNTLASRHRVSSMPFGQITPEELKFEHTVQEAPERSPEPPRFVLDSVEEDSFSVDPFEYLALDLAPLLPAFVPQSKVTKRPQNKAKALDTPLAQMPLDTRSPLTPTNGRSPSQLK